MRVAPYVNSGPEAVRRMENGRPPDHWPTNGWRSTTPEEQGIDSAGIAEALDEFGGRNLHSFALIREGYLVAEGYSREWDAEKLHPMYSVTKSFTSAVAGMAIKDEALNSVNQRLGEFFPEVEDPKKADITIAQLLSMSSGLHWSNKGERSSVEMTDSPDWVQYVLDQAMSEPPGTAFRYCNGNAHLMSGLLQRAIGLPIGLFAEHKLFAPMGIRSFGWGADPQGVTIGSWALYLTARDMAKLGLLYLNGGTWEGQELIPRSFVEASVQKQMMPAFKDGSQGGYGYFWWVKPIYNVNRTVLAFYAAGSGGQRIFVVPELSLILATTGNNQREDFMPERLLAQMVSAVKSDRALPANEKAFAKLQASVAAFKREVDKPESFFL